MSAGQIIETAKQASAEQLGQSRAGTQFASEVENSVKISTILTPNEAAQLSRELGFTPIFQNTKKVVHDHRVIYSLREVVREELFQSLASSSATETLFVGCSAFELSNKTLYDNPAYKFSLHGSEAKDVSRIVPSALASLSRKLKSKLNKADRALLAQAGADFAAEGSPLVARFRNVKSLISALHSGDFSAVPRVGFNIFPEVSRIVSLDSSYNFSAVDYINLFVRTGAHEMLCVSILPYELVFEDCPPNELYSYREFEKGGKVYSAIAFRNGYSDGYVHEKNNWATLLREKTIVGPDFSLNVEFVTRAGPMTLVRLTRSKSMAPVFRVLELPEHLKFVRYLDIVKSHSRCPKFSQLTYRSVREAYWWATVKYLLSLDPKSLNTTNAMSYVRRSMAGVSMAGVTHQEKWYMDSEDVVPMVLASVAFVEMAHGAVKEAHEGFLSKAKSYNWKLFLEKLALSTAIVMTLGLAVPVANFVAWMTTKGLADKVLVTPSMERVTFSVPEESGQEKTAPSPDILLNIEEFAVKDENEDFKPRKNSVGDYTYLGANPACSFCSGLKDRLGSQLVSCGYRPDSTVEWSMSSEELAAFKNEMITASTDPTCAEGLAKTLKEAIEAVPSTGFTWRGRLELVKAGPGCGKSYVARALYDDDVMIYAPFSKLRADYMSQTREDGTMFDMLFKTTHKGLSGRGKAKIYVDEWTCMDWRAMVIALHNNGSKSVSLFGDRLQTCIQPGEGVFSGLKFQDSDVSNHELVVNFRNPRWIVGVLNKDYGYSMSAASKELGKPEILDLSKASSVTDMKVINFSHAAAAHKVDQNSDTVRSNQGGTETDVGLVVTDADRNLVMNDQLFRVAISRHRRNLTIFVEEGTEMEAMMRSKLHLDDDSFTSSLSKLCKPDLSSKVNESDVDGPGGADILEACGFFRDISDSETLVGEELQWCSADVVEAYLGTRVAAEYKRHILANKGAHVHEGMISLYSLTSFLEKKGFRVCVMTDSYKMVYRSKYSEARMLTVILEEDDHVRMPESGREKVVSEVRTLSIATDTDNEVGSRHVYKCLVADMAMFMAKDGVLLYEKDDFWVRILTRFAAEKLVRYEERENIFVGRWKLEDSMVKASHAEIPVSQRQVMEAYGLVFCREDYKPADLVELPQDAVERPLQPASDAHAHADTFSPAFSVDNMSFLNENAARAGMLNVPRTGDLAVDWLTQVNSRGHPVDYNKRAMKGYALCIGEGLRFFGDNQFQSLQAVAHRYFRKRKVFRFNKQAEDLANRMADTFVSERQTPVVVDVHKEADIVREWELVSLQRNYEKRRQGESEFDSMVIRHHLKDIFKPTKDLVISGGNPFLQDAINTLKPGQGISAWSSEANIKFGAVTRIINHRWLSSLKFDTTYNNKFSDAEIDEQLSAKRSLILPGSKTGVTDGADFDSMQNKFTQQIEKRHSHHLLVPKVLIDSYYQYRNDYRMVENGLFSGRARSEKTSGEPGTLLYNSQLGGTVCNFSLRGIGQSTMEIQGDDAKKTQVGLKADAQALGSIANYSDFKLKVNIGKNQEFCGNVEIDGTLVPSVHRMFKKLSAQTFKSAKHFYEYKMAILDKIKRIERVGHQITVAASASAINVSYEEMDALYDSVKSFSHISYEQFMAKAIPVHSTVGTPNLIM